MTPIIIPGAVFVVIVVPVQSVPITTSVVSSNPAHSEAHRIQHYEIILVSDFQQVVCSPVSSTNRADGQDMAKILLKVAENIHLVFLKYDYILLSFTINK